MVRGNTKIECNETTLEGSALGESSSKSFRLKKIEFENLSGTGELLINQLAVFHEYTG